MSSESGSYYVAGAAGRASVPTTPYHSPVQPSAPVARTLAPRTSKTQTATLWISVFALIFSVIAAVAASYSAYVIYRVIEGLKEAFPAQ